MRKVSLNDLEVEIVKAIKKWRDELLQDEIIHIDEIDAGNASDLASTIATEIVGFGVGIAGEWKADRKLSEGWE